MFQMLQISATSSTSLSLGRILLIQFSRFAYTCTIGTLHQGLLLHSSSQSELTVYLDADCTGCLATRKSTLGYVVFLHDNLFLSRRSVRTVSWSSAEAENHAVANGLQTQPCCDSFSSSSTIHLCTLCWSTANISIVYHQPRTTPTHQVH